MRAAKIRAGIGYACAAVLATGLLLGTSGCGLDEASVPDPQGPSDAGVSVDMVALPDTLNADGVSQSVVRLILRDDKGRPIGGKAVLFDCDNPAFTDPHLSCGGDGYLVPSTASTYVGPIQTGLVMATDQNGVAHVVYVAGTIARTVTVVVRPYGIDTALTSFTRNVQIVQR